MLTKLVAAVQKQDKRNVFKPFLGEVTSIPEEFREFYKTNNPVDVEIRLDNLSQIRFYSVERLPAIKKEYNLPESAFCFATSNGDPIYYLNGKIYTEAHGGDPSPELLARSFNDYIQFIIKHLRIRKIR
ncbi:MAG: SMI1/KNR4 family protein [Thermodesulfobacteriota bacterium]|nr:SMI1/KNR4 family protein [Thermodesulfobacteriota bacterium]